MTSIVGGHKLISRESEMVNEAKDTITILNKYVDALDIDVNLDNLKKVLHSLHREARFTVGFMLIFEKFDIKISYQLVII